MIRVLRIIIGLPLGFFALGYMVIGAMFMTGEPPYDSGAGRVLALTGLLGFCGPVVLFGLHLAFSGPAAPRPVRTALAGALGATAVLGLGGGLYALGQPDITTDAANMLFTVVLSTTVFGAPILRARFFGEAR